MPVLLTGLIVSGCLVGSLHPFYFEDDLVFKEELLGEWMDQDSGQWIIKQRFVKESFMGKENPVNSYIVTFQEKDDVQSSYFVHLFRLKDKYYLDFFPEDNGDFTESDMLNYHLLALHTLGKIDFLGDSLKVQFYNDDWLNRLFEENRIRIKHETVRYMDYDRHILTASTKELQKFILKYGDDPRAFKEVDKEDEVFTWILKRKE